MSYPKEVAFEDIRAGDKVEVTSTREGTVLTGVVRSSGSSYDARAHYLRFSSGITVYFYINDITFRLLHRPVDDPAVGQIIPRTAYITLPPGTIIDDERMGLVSITATGTGKKRIRRVSDHNFSWPSLADPAKRGLIRHLPPEGCNEYWNLFDKEGWKQANGG